MLAMGIHLDTNLQSMVEHIHILIKCVDNKIEYVDKG
jgi:hypothetical protein